MPGSLIYTQIPWTETYSEIIDVRSPSEFAEDRIPGAINLPVLDDIERAEVGTIYKQDSPFKARKLGAAKVSQNISWHLINHFGGKQKDYRPLVYCWRGGQRSHSMATVLKEIGWQVTLLQGGYKTYRSYVCQQLQEIPEKLNFRILCGLTGTGKTYILRQMAKQGFQVLDLEYLANHRGSLLGQEWRVDVESTTLIPTQQPQQKYFESLLLQAIQSFNPNQSVWVEAESNKIGSLHLPKIIWQKMKQANCIEINLSIEARISQLLQEYPYLTTHPEFLKQKLLRLKSKQGWDRINKWFHLIDTCEWEVLIKELLQYHYDPSYTQSLGKTYSHIKQLIKLVDLSTTSINELICQLQQI